MKFTAPVKYVLLTLLALLVLPVLRAEAFRGYVQTTGDVSVDWGNGKIAVSRELEIDQDRFDAAHQTARMLRKAAVEGRKLMLDSIYGIRIDSNITVGAFLNDNDAVDARLRRLIQNSRLERPEFMDGKGTLVVTEELRNELAELVLPTTIQFQSGIPPKLDLGVDSLADMGADMTMVEPTGMMAGSGTYTGLVIDASHLMETSPALTPVIYGRNGVAVYGAYLVGRSEAVRNGVVAYSTSSDPVILRSRVGDRPLVVHALALVGTGKTDLIISGTDAELARILLKDPLVLEQCRVVVVLPQDVEPGESVEEEILQ